MKRAVPDKYNGLGTRAKNIIQNQFGGDINKVARASRMELLAMPNLGASSVKNIEEWLAKSGLSLAEASQAEDRFTFQAIGPNLFSAVRDANVKLNEINHIFLLAGARNTMSFIKAKDRKGDE